MRFEQRHWSWAVAFFLFTTVWTTGATLMIFEGPRVLVIMAGLTLLFLFVTTIYATNAIDLLSEYCKRKNWRVLWIPNSRSLLGLSVLISLVVSVLLWKFAEPQLWARGNFGEPPSNRYVAINYDAPYFLVVGFGVNANRVQDGYMNALVEFGASSQPTRGIDVAIDFGYPCNEIQKGQILYAPPNLRSVSEVIGRAVRAVNITSEGGGLAVGGGQVCKEKLFSMRTFEDSLTPNQSIYVLFISNLRLRINVSNCYVRHLDEGDGRTCKSGIRLIEREPQQ